MAVNGGGEQWWKAVNSGGGVGRPNDDDNDTYHHHNYHWEGGVWPLMVVVALRKGVVCDCSVWSVPD